MLFKTARGAILLPAVTGFHAEDRTDGPVVNIVFYVFLRLLGCPIVAPEVDCGGTYQQDTRFA